jgi:hypothetical protein
MNSKEKGSRNERRSMALLGVRRDKLAAVSWFALTLTRPAPASSTSVKLSTFLCFAEINAAPRDLSLEV